MSKNIQYIGLNVHKEAISIAVLNGTGKLVNGIDHTIFQTAVAHSDSVENV